MDGFPVPTNGFVTGTLSGLVEGNNAGSGITATVTSSPGGGGVGSGYTFFDGGNPAFTVTGGNITFAYAGFINGSNLLYLGTLGNGGFYNELTPSDFSFSFDYSDVSKTTTTFAPVSAAVPFELNSIAGLATLGLCFGAAKLRRKHLAKKLVVSV